MIQNCFLFLKQQIAQKEALYCHIMDLQITSEKNGALVFHNVFLIKTLLECSIHP